ncbi:hypothetical protein [Microbacterium sp.]|uniref:hypothetical protein n=1 Tax=Microbacterium sp. TaxID=51671 RepID=UPI0035B212D7
MTDAEGGSAADELGRLDEVDTLIARTVVDGVPVLFAPGDGPVSGGLVFRVGWADEQLARSGITHLVEHLALFGQDPSAVHHNGSTGDFSTHFHATGRPDEVVAFLNAVCAALRGLPLDRMEVEKGILDTEAARRSSHVAERLRLERYGARGLGLGGYEGFGLPAVTEADLTAWVEERLGRLNAVAWITTDAVPEGLDLRLPEGRRWPVPRAEEIVPDGPSFFRGAQGGVLLDGVVLATAAGVVFADVASRALFRSLRQEGGLSYEARCDWERIDADRARLSIFADALPEKQSAVVGEIIDVLAAMRVGRIDGDALAAAQTAADDLPEPSSLGAQLLPAAAFKLLAGYEIRSPQRLAAEYAAVTAADLVELARELQRTALAQIPEGSLDWAGFTALPAWSRAEVEGVSYAFLGEAGGELVVGRDGVMARESGGAVTVRFADAEALEVWPDGARRIVGADGFQILIEPTMYDGLSSDELAGVDAAVPERRHVRRPARSPESVPQPPR